MKPQAFQPGELRDEHDQIIRAGAYGKKTPFVSSDNNAILDYIMNNFDALYAQIPNGKTYVKSVNNITPDSNGNVTINLGSGGGTGGTNITVDSALSSTSTNPVQNKVLYAALNNKLDKNGTATYAACDSSGNIISSTYARKTELSGYVKSINNVKPDGAGNVNISTGGGGTGTSITVDTALSGTSNNAIANKAVYAALNNKLDKTGTAAAATKATQDSYGNVIVTTYARKSDLSGYVKSINNVKPDSAGNVNISTGSTNVTPDLTPYMKKTADSDLVMGGNRIVFPGVTFVSDVFNGVPILRVKAKSTRGIFVEGNLLQNNAFVATRDYVQENYAQLDSPTFTGTVTASDVVASTSLTIPGGKIWIE